MQRLLKKYKIKNRELAKLFGYKNENSFNSSSSKDDMLKGCEQLLALIEQKIVDRITN